MRVRKPGGVLACLLALAAPASLCPERAMAVSKAPVAYRAAFLLGSSGDMKEFTTKEGSVTWRLEPRDDDPTGRDFTAVAHVDILGDRFRVDVRFERNTDRSVHASHLVILKFDRLAGSPIGEVKRIGMPQPRREEVGAGDALKGSFTAVADDVFLVELAKSKEAENVALLSERGWIDVPILLRNGTVAKVTFEKGDAGIKALAAVIGTRERHAR